MKGYSDFTATQLLTIVRAFGWRVVPCRGANVRLEPEKDDARAGLPKGLALAVHEKRIALRTLLALEQNQARNRSFTGQMGDNQ